MLIGDDEIGMAGTVEEAGRERFLLNRGDGVTKRGEGVRVGPVMLSRCDGISTDRFGVVEL